MAFQGKDGKWYEEVKQPQHQQRHQNRNSNHQNNDNEQFKSSGVTFTKLKNKSDTDKGKALEGRFMANAWRATKMGLMTCTVMPYVGDGGLGLEVVTSYKGETKEKNYWKCIATVLYMGQSTTYPCLMNVKTHTVVLDKLSLCITETNKAKPTRSGKMVSGYFGRNYQK